MKQHHVRTTILATALGLLLPATSQAQFIGFPFLGYGAFGNYRNMYGLYGRTYVPITSPYMNPGLSAFSGGAGYGGAYNPLQFNASFNPVLYNPTPSVYNPAVYNAAFNPSFSQTGPAYALEGTTGSGTRPAIGQAPASERLRPRAVSPRSGRIEVLVPTSDAQVTLEGVLMKQTGTERAFRTPPLNANEEYSYEVQVRWRDARGSHTETRRVRFRGGQDVLVDFRTTSS
jgi:uncharacterized protein (TIGR03000 family)